MKVGLDGFIPVDSRRESEHMRLFDHEHFTPPQCTHKVHSLVLVRELKPSEVFYVMTLVRITLS